mgnify:FL=1
MEVKLEHDQQLLLISCQQSLRTDCAHDLTTEDLKAPVENYPVLSTVAFLFWALIKPLVRAQKGLATPKVSMWV